MKNRFLLSLSLLMIGCSATGSSSGPSVCEPVKDVERCSGPRVRQACSKEDSVWENIEVCEGDFFCDSVGDETTVCKYVDPNACESHTDCTDTAACVFSRCVPDHCYDEALSGDEFGVDCGGSCYEGCDNGKPCVSNEGCSLGCCGSGGVCVDGDGFGSECVCSNSKATGPACDECFGGWTGGACEFCSTNWKGENCDECANGWTGENCDTCPTSWIGENCDVCATNWTGESCDECPQNWGGENCDECSFGWKGSKCDSCSKNWKYKECDACAGGWSGDDCDVCQENWTGDDCDVCANGWTGGICQICPDNRMGESCDQCSNGWTGPNCDVCPDGWLGENCEDPCGAITFEGCCDGTTLMWCEAADLNSIECPSSCGWDSANGYYVCEQSGAEPSGVHPWDCPSQ